jgi:hypothetical protein
MKIQDTTLIHPEDKTNIHYWTKKWGVSNNQLNDAILYTGSLNPGRIKEYLKKEGWFEIPFFGLIKLFRAKAPAIH